MRITNPSVYLLACPQIDFGTVEDFLQDIGTETAAEWVDARIYSPPGEVLTELAGRTCYRSFEPGLNKNVTRIRKDRQTYLTNILSSGHGSVLEHAQYTFAFHNVSRVFTHELVRHRAGVAISQESLRFVRLDEIGLRIPPILERFSTEIVSIVERLEEFQREAAEEFGLDDEGVPFHYKKEVTSALRRLAPCGLSTTIIWSANIRTLRHVIESRTATGAEEELRLVFNEVGEIMKREAPFLFDDYEVVDGAWVTPFGKV